MEKTIKERKVTEIEETYHEFYCDECNNYLGVSHESADGWYKELNKLVLNLNVDGWLHIEKHLCPRCQNKFIDKIRKNLLDIGFTFGLK